MATENIPLRKLKNPRSQEVGLRIFNLFGSYFLKTDHLHYGFWPEDLTVELSNLSKAQDLYTEHICDRIPEGVGSILDIGCGTGHNAEVLLSRGYEVDCVSPSEYLSELTRKRIQDRGTLYECIFEDLPLGKKYDCLLFSESFQYIDLATVFSRMPEFLNPDGCVVISDFFRIPAEGVSAMGGGHRLSRFFEQLEKSRFELIFEEDITAYTAPNLQLVNDVLQNVALPLRNLLLDEMDRKYRFFYRQGRFFSRLFFRKKLDKLDYKYFSGARNAENFRKFKKYCMFTLKLKSE